MGTCGTVGWTSADTATAEPSSLLLSFSESSSLKENLIVTNDLNADLIYTETKKTILSADF